MKKKHSTSEFTSERNTVLLNHFRKALVADSQRAVARAFKEAAGTPAPRFWVSEARAAHIIGRMLAGDDPTRKMFEEKRAMYREIFARFMRLRAERPEATIYELVFEVVNQPAPSSYISWQRAKSVIYAEYRRRRKSHAGERSGI
jgi:hypothetical protein